MLAILEHCNLNLKTQTTDKRAFEDMASSSGRFLLASSAGAETSLEDRDKN
jgi:hypothetical protein